MVPNRPTENTRSKEIAIHIDYEPVTIDVSDTGMTGVIRFATLAFEGAFNRNHEAFLDIIQAVDPNSLAGARIISIALQHKLLHFGTQLQLSRKLDLDVLCEITVENVDEIAEIIHHLMKAEVFRNREAVSQVSQAFTASILIARAIQRNAIDAPVCVEHAAISILKSHLCEYNEEAISGLLDIFSPENLVRIELSELRQKLIPCMTELRLWFYFPEMLEKLVKNFDASSQEYRDAIEHLLLDCALEETFEDMVAEKLHAFVGIPADQSRLDQCLPLYKALSDGGYQGIHVRGFPDWNTLAAPDLSSR